MHYTRRLALLRQDGVYKTALMVFFLLFYLGHDTETP